MTLFGGVLTWVFEFVHETPLELTPLQARQVMASATSELAPAI